MQPAHVAQPAIALAEPLASRRRRARRRRARRAPVDGNSTSTLQRPRAARRGSIVQRVSIELGAEAMARLDRQRIVARDRRPPRASGTARHTDAAGRPPGAPRAPRGASSSRSGGRRRLARGRPRWLTTRRPVPTFRATTPNAAGGPAADPGGHAHLAVEQPRQLGAAVRQPLVVDDRDRRAVRGRGHREPPDVGVVRVQRRRHLGRQRAEPERRRARRVGLDPRRRLPRVAEAARRARSRRTAPAAGALRPPRRPAVEQREPAVEEVLGPAAVLGRRLQRRRGGDGQQRRLARGRASSPGASGGSSRPVSQFR